MRKPIIKKAGMRKAKRNEVDGPIGRSKVAGSAKYVIEQNMRGWTLDESARGGSANGKNVDVARRSQSDFIAKDFATIKKKYNLETAGNSNTNVVTPSDSRLVTVKSNKTQDDSALGTRSALVINGKIKSVQG